MKLQSTIIFKFDFFSQMLNPELQRVHPIRERNMTEFVFIIIIIIIVSRSVRAGPGVG